MSGRGRKASLPPASHTRPDVLAADGLSVEHWNSDGRLATYDFGTLPVAEPLQRSLARLFAARCVPGRWERHTTSRCYWVQLQTFAAFLSQQEAPPRDLDGLTVALLKRWRTARPRTGGGYSHVTLVVSLLRDDPRLRTGRVADELALRFPRPASRTQSYSEADFAQVKTAARRSFRAAWLRIGENGAHLARWREGSFIPGSREWTVGEALDGLARTGDLPMTVDRNGKRTLIHRYRAALGGTRSEVTCQRLFLSRLEAVSLGVLLMAEYGWNLSVIDGLHVPKASPDAGEDGHPTYRIPLEKARRGPGHHHESRNVTDDGATSKGRLITRALQATVHARAFVETHRPGTDRLILWRGQIGRHPADLDRDPPVGPIQFGVDKAAAKEWARREALGGSPFTRGRRTVNALERREPGQNSQTTHDSRYVLVDQRVQEEAIPVIAAGAESAVARAAAVLVAEIRDEPTAGDVATATADCGDYHASPYPAPDGSCGASFLMCLGCTNARVHPGHHSRLAHLHHALANLRSVLPAQAWTAGWEEPYARLEHLKTQLGAGQWTRALAADTDADREIVGHLLTGDLDT